MKRRSVTERCGRRHSNTLTIPVLFFSFNVLFTFALFWFNYHSLYFIIFFNVVVVSFYLHNAGVYVLTDKSVNLSQWRSGCHSRRLGWWNASGEKPFVYCVWEGQTFIAEKQNTKKNTTKRGTRTTWMKFRTSRNVGVRFPSRTGNSCYMCNGALQPDGGGLHLFTCRHAENCCLFFFFCSFSLLQKIPWSLFEGRG